MMQLDTVILKLRVPIDGRQRRRVSSILPCLVVAFALARPLHAQTCSGGVGGGMDATGSLCNLPVATMTVSAEATAHVVQGREGAAWEASEPRLRTDSLATRRVLTEARDAEAWRSFRRGAR